MRRRIELVERIQFKIMSSLGFQTVDEMMRFDRNISSSEKAFLDGRMNAQFRLYTEFENVTNRYLGSEAFEFALATEEVHAEYCYTESFYSDKTFCIRADFYRNYFFPCSNMISSMKNAIPHSKIVIAIVHNFLLS